MDTLKILDLGMMSPKYFLNIKTSAYDQNIL